MTVTDVDAKKTIQTFRLYSQVTCLEWISEDTFATSSEVEGIIQIWKIGEAKSTKILIHGPVGVSRIPKVLPTNRLKGFWHFGNNDVIKLFRLA